MIYHNRLPACTASSNATVIYGTNTSCAAMGSDPSALVMSVSMGSCAFLDGAYIRATMVASGDELMALAATTGGNLFPMIWLAGNILGQFRYEQTPVGCVTNSPNNATHYVQHSCNRGKSSM